MLEIVGLSVFEIICDILILGSLFLLAKCILFDPIKDAIDKLERTVDRLCEGRIEDIEEDVFKIRNCLEGIAEDNKFKK